MNRMTDIKRLAARITRALAVVLILLSIATDQAPAADGSYVSIRFSDGIPEFAPLSHLKLSQLKHAEIRLGLAKRIYVIWGKKDTGKDAFWLTAFGSEGGSVSSGPVEKSDDGNYSGTITTRELDELSPGEEIDVEVMVESGTMRYQMRYRSDSSLTPQPVRNLTGTMLPDFEVRLMDGSSRKVSDFSDKTLVLNWWATTCSPCIAEMPGLNTLVEKYADDPVVFLAIAWNKPGEIETFLQKTTFSYTQATYTNDSFDVLGNSFPRNVIVGPGGRVVYDHTGGSVHTHRDLDPVIHNTIGM